MNKYIDHTILKPFAQQKDIGRKIAQPLRFVGDDRGVFLALFVGDVVALQLPGKAADGHDGRLEFVGKAVHEVRAEHLRVLKFAGQRVEGVRHLLHGAEIAGVKPLFKAAVRQRIHRRQQLLNGS